MSHHALGKRKLQNLSAARAAAEVSAEPGTFLELRTCQKACLKACAQGARMLELACGTGKTRIIHELAASTSGRATR